MLDLYCQLRRHAAALVLVVVCCASAIAAPAPQNAAIASAHPLATAAGRTILGQGGNAFDAAVAVAAALAVVEPYSSGLGGGGFFLLHRASDGYQTMVDARETAPSGVTRSQYFDEQGRPRPNATTRGGTAAAIPGTPAALAHLALRYGRLPLAATLAPAIRLAADGFDVDPRFVQIAKMREKFLQSGAGTDVFLDRGKAPEAGFLLKQPDLAATLTRLAREGARGFYQGPVARAMLDAVNRAGGAWRAADLEQYAIQERQPVRFTYRGARITAAALPSAGGVALAQSLAILENFKPGPIGEPAEDHLVVEALRRAFQDRERYLGDPEFAHPPLDRLVSGAYAQQRAAGIDPNRATASAALGGREPAARAHSTNTTHFSIVDGEGNRVAATVTINLLFGSGIVAPGTGVLLNNEMDDFTLGDAPNAFLLRGGAANRIEPRKRPLSSMTPTFVEDEKGVLVLGAPGGSRIVSQVLLATLAYLDTPEVDLARIVALPRYHHQFWPDRVEVEPQGFSNEWRAAMRAKGHEIAISSRRWGNMQAVFRAKNGAVQAASDPRGEGVAWY
ncbi:MAG TPA: gamma-glutamyltransferase [Burkholderiales bacterium]|nr:gamma-glutamyltransferase [Burkholderiales bacterium]